MSLLQDGQNITILVPLRIATIGPRHLIRAKYQLRLDNNIALTGELQTEAEAGSCNISGDVPCGTCGDVCIEVFVGIDGPVFLGLFFVNKFERQCTRYNCERQTDDSGQSIGCGCVGTLVFSLGPIPEQQLPPGRVLTFILDPDNQLPEFNEVDNITTVSTSQPRCP